MDRTQLLYKAVSHIPKGKVTTYARVGKIVGILNPRLVGTLLHKNPDPKNTPCHRVVTSIGTLASTYAFGGASVQKCKLIAEGVVFKNNRVDIRQCLWKPSKAQKTYFQSLKLEKDGYASKKPQVDRICE
jgi:methylated-DNA-protein-cysteine methyltransferase-like protein